jgi:ferritin-like metal-binding protein YciE
MPDSVLNMAIYDLRLLRQGELEQATQLEALAGVAKEDKQLQEMLVEHQRETMEQAERLAQILTALGAEIDASVPSAVQGLSDDARTTIARYEAQPLRQLALVSAALKMERYEITCYELAVAVAEKLGLAAALPLLQQSLEEERHAEERFRSAAISLIDTQAAREIVVREEAPA